MAAPQLTGRKVGSYVTVGQATPLARELKHVNIYNAINTLEVTADKYRNFLNELRGTDDQEEKRPESPVPPFADVIDGSPDRLINLNERIRNILDELRQLIL